MRAECEICSIAVVKFYQIRKKAVCRHCKKDFFQHGRFLRKRVKVDYAGLVKILQRLSDPASCSHCRSRKGFDEGRRQFFCARCNVWLERIA